MKIYCLVYVRLSWFRTRILVSLYISLPCAYFSRYPPLLQRRLLVPWKFPSFQAHLRVNFHGLLFMFPYPAHTFPDIHLYSRKFPSLQAHLHVNFHGLLFMYPSLCIFFQISTSTPEKASGPMEIRLLISSFSC